jgi:predicted anti-sigma-YlaC factor YlaD
MTCAEARSLLSLRLDHELAPDDEAPLMEHVLGCASCRAAQHQMDLEHDLLSRQWTAVVAPIGLSNRIARSLPPRQAPKRSTRWLRRPAPALAGALAALLIAVSVAIPPVRAGIGTLLESVSLREISNPPAEQRLGEGPVLTLDEARQQVPWRIRTPGALPDG